MEVEVKKKKIGLYGYSCDDPYVSMDCNVCSTSRQDVRFLLLTYEYKGCCI